MLKQERREQSNNKRSKVWLAATGLLSLVVVFALFSVGSEQTASVTNSVHDLDDDVTVSVTSDSHLDLSASQSVVTAEDNGDLTVEINNGDKDPVLVNFVGKQEDTPFYDRVISHFSGDSNLNSLTGVLEDISGNGHDSEAQGGPTGVTIADVNFNGKMLPVIKGPASTPSNFLTWSDAVGVFGSTPEKTTLFHVTRYGAGARGRIITSVTGNWLDGHWSSNAGWAYHEGWLEPKGSSFPQEDWVLSWSTATRYRSYSGSQRKDTSLSSGKTSSNLKIGAWQTNREPSENWQVAELIIYDGILSDIEGLEVVNFFNNKYSVIN